jgi:hypothetical protein
MLWGGEVGSIGGDVNRGAPNAKAERIEPIPDLTVLRLNRTSLFQNCKALISLSFIESEGSVTGYDPG